MAVRTLVLGCSIVGGLALLQACTGAPGDASGFRLLDSAGVSIAINGLRALDEAPTIVIREPILDLATAGDPDPHLFDQVRGGVLLRSGTVAIADQGSSQVRVFSADGQLVASHGRNGEGPGEFRDLRQLAAMRGDSLFVFDASLSRATVLASDGSLGRVVNLRFDEEFVAWAAPAPDGSIVGARHSPPAQMFGEIEGFRLDSALILRFDPRGVREGQVARTPVREVVYQRSSPIPGRFVFRIPVYGFYTESEVAGDRLIMPAARSEFALRVLSLSRNEVEREIRLQVEPVSLTRGQVLDRWAELMERFSPGTPVAAYDLPIPDVVPPYSQLLGGAHGSIWVSEYAQWEDPALWYVFNAVGRLVARVIVESGGLLLAVDDDALLVLDRDSLDVEHPTLYALPGDLERLLGPGA